MLDYVCIFKDWGIDMQLVTYNRRNIDNLALIRVFRVLYEIGSLNCKFDIGLFYLN